MSPNREWREHSRACKANICDTARNCGYDEAYDFVHDHERFPERHNSFAFVLARFAELHYANMIGSYVRGPCETCPFPCGQKGQERKLPSAESLQDFELA